MATKRLIHQARRWYVANMDVTFWEDLENHVAEGGYAYVGPECVAIAARVGNGWFIRFAVGRGALTHLRRLMPYQLPFVGWARVSRGKPEVVWHDFSRLDRMLHYERFKNLAVLPIHGGPDRSEIPEPVPVKL